MTRTTPQARLPTVSIMHMLAAHGHCLHSKDIQAQRLQTSLQVSCWYCNSFPCPCSCLAKHSTGLLQAWRLHHVCNRQQTPTASQQDQHFTQQLLRKPAPLLHCCHCTCHCPLPTTHCCCSCCYAAASAAATWYPATWYPTKDSLCQSASAHLQSCVRPQGYNRRPGI